MKGHATLTAAQVADLEAGKWYFNVHTAKNPNGEIRGQVEQAK
ncbi:MAG: CHRD domain-containing protein [Devosia sp.]